MYDSIDMLLDDLHQKKDQIESLAKQYGAKRIRVFGSVARREETDKSDIDLLVDLPRGYDMFRQRLPLHRKLKELLNREVDLIANHELNKHIAVDVRDEAIDL